MDTDNIEHGGDESLGIICSFSSSISNEVISTLARTRIPSAPWPSLALRARFARFRRIAILLFAISLVDFRPRSRTA
jgi:hypothetical protein